ncbi:MAG TPA: ABC transporter ATP-binding protein [Ilumatobacteraceae bacterium]|jgi:ABC-2 type transport system ATP-binding protein|nr:ABC transporter ATP-binding protein [Ilumatobacteraceae bacterium]
METQTLEAPPQARQALALETSDLTKVYGDRTAVNALSLQVRRGEIFGLLGPNGAGKTTTILMLLGLTEPSSGAARVDGLDPRKDPLSVKRRVGYLPDDVGFYDDVTARENLQYTARLNRIPEVQAGERIEYLLDQVGLSAVIDRRVRTFSRGMRQRLGLADALIKSPSILILDEPTVNIDPEGVRELLTFVGDLRDVEGMTVLLSSHLLHQVEQVCDRIGIFVAGQLVGLGTVAELANDLEDGWTFELGVDPGPSTTQLVEAIGAVSGVNRVEVDGPGRWVVNANRDVHAELVTAAASNDCTIHHFVRRGADLDAIYHHYFIGSTDDSNHRLSA